VGVGLRPDGPEYVDSTLGDSSVNTCWEVDAEKAFVTQPLGLRTPAAIRG
jgi:hypothetical protein